MKKTLCLILAAVMVLFAFAACGDDKPEQSGEQGTTASNVPSSATPTVLSYTEFMALEDGKDACVETYVQFKTAYSADYKNASLFLGDDTGAYYAYRVAFETQADYDTVAVGAKVRVSGQKTSWSGEVEFAEGSAKIEVLGTETKILAAKDVSAATSSADLEKEMNKLVKMKNVTVTSSSMKDPANSSAMLEKPFLYKWDGSGSQGDDIYFNVELNGQAYTFVVETDLSNKDSDAYKAVEALKVGDKVELEGFMYWYNGPQMQITKVTK